MRAAKKFISATIGALALVATRGGVAGSTTGAETGPISLDWNGGHYGADFCEGSIITSTGPHADNRGVTTTHGWGTGCGGPGTQRTPLQQLLVQGAVNGQICTDYGFFRLDPTDDFSGYYFKGGLFACPQPPGVQYYNTYSRGFLYVDAGTVGIPYGAGLNSGYEKY